MMSVRVFTWPLLSVFLLASSIRAQNIRTDCSVFDEVPESRVFLPGEGGCVDCRYRTRAARWQIELDTGFTAINTGQEPEDCDCTLTPNARQSSELCFSNVDESAARNYRCQVQEPDSIDSVQCDFEIQLAMPPVITSPGLQSVVSNTEETVELPLSYRDGVPASIVTWSREGGMPLGNRFTVNNLSRNLIITGVKPEDRGRYTVTVGNMAGNVTADYDLFVNFLEITEVRADTVENGFILVCSAQVYPGPVDNIRMSFLQLNDSNNAFEFSHRNFMYEIRTTLRVPVSSCPPSGYMCVLEVGGDQEVGSARVIGDPVICSQSLTIERVDPVGLTSAVVHWVLLMDPQNDFIITYYQSGATSSDYVSASSTDRMITLQGLMSGIEYSVQVSVRGSGTNSPVFMFTLQPCHSNIRNPIVGVSAAVVTGDGGPTIRLSWEASVEAEVTGYRVFVEPYSSGPLPIDGPFNTFYNFPSEICDGQSRSFIVQAVNDCFGGGPNSSLVVRRCNSIDRLVELEPRSTTVLIKWDYMSVPDIIVVMARLIGSAGQSSVATLNYTVTGSSVAVESACIAGLESETTYEVCLTPTFRGSTSQQPYCGFVTTNSVGSSDFTNDCFDPTITVPTQGAGLGLANWHIAVIVVGGLAIVAMVFCFIGICFACQSSSKKVDFGSSSSLNTATYNSSIRDGVSLQHQRSMSPSRSCLSYHTKGHSTNWSDHVDTLRQMETDTGTHV